MSQGSSAPCFPSTTEPEGMNHSSQLYHDLMAPSYDNAGHSSALATHTQFRAILCNLTILKQKVHQVEALISFYLSHQSPQHSQPFASLGTLIQEIVVNASSMMFNCQQMTITNSTNDGQIIQAEAQNLNHITDISGCGMNNRIGLLQGDGCYNWYNDDDNNNNSNITASNNYTSSTRADSCSRTSDKSKAKEKSSQPFETYDLVEPEAADLLAKYTHYCQVCGKGFKRDANLRMHMRAHGDEYKSSAALSNPLKNQSKEEIRPPRKYSCPQQGCRWNKNHAKFQPLKSIICVKNHYKRTHCPKMYVCKRCNRKQFSVLSDLRTHEKHCGDRKWMCSCGTTFSRKDKLMGHVTLFVGHTPVVAQLGDI